MSNLRLESQATDFGGLQNDGHDPIMVDEKRLGAVAALVEQHGTALKDVIDVRMKYLEYFMFNKAPDELMPHIQEAWSSIKNLLGKFDEYQVEYKARLEQKKLAQANEDKPVK